MQLSQLLTKQPTALVTPFIADYAAEADRPAHNKKYYFGRGSLKWALSIILTSPNSPPFPSSGGVAVGRGGKGLTDAEIRVLLHHILLELATLPNPEETCQFEIWSLTSLTLWRGVILEQKRTYNIAALLSFFAGNYKFICNPTGLNLTGMIFRKTNADAIIMYDPEQQSAGLVFRVNSRIMENDDFVIYMIKALAASEPGWNAVGDPVNLFINHGLRNQTPTIHNTETILKIIQDYFTS